MRPRTRPTAEPLPPDLRDDAAVGLPTGGEHFSCEAAGRAGSPRARGHRRRDRPRVLDLSRGAPVKRSVLADFRERLPARSISGLGVRMSSGGITSSASRRSKASSGSLSRQWSNLRALSRSGPHSRGAARARTRSSVQRLPAAHAASAGCPRRVCRLPTPRRPNWPRGRRVIARCGRPCTGTRPVPIRGDPRRRHLADGVAELLRIVALSWRGSSLCAVAARRSDYT